MQLAGKITYVEKRGKASFELKLKLTESICDTAKLHRSLKNKEVCLVREFSTAAPAPSVGELVVLDETESREILDSLMPAVEVHEPKSGKAISQTADFNLDGYDELFLSNDIMSSMISPKRGGIIQHLGAKGFNGLIEDTVLQGVMAKLACGMGFDSTKKDFDISNAKFKIAGSYCGAKLEDEIEVPLRAKLGGMKTTVNIAISSQSPALSYNLHIANKVKKAKPKKVSPTFHIRLKQMDNRNSRLVCIQPDGEKRRFVKRVQIPVWCWHEHWYMYIGDIQAGNSGFIVLKREDTGEALLLSFQPGQVSRIWHNSGSYMPEIIIFARQKTLAKNKSTDFDISLCPINRIRVEDGYLLAYIEDRNGFHAISAGPRARNFIIDDEEITADKIGPTIYHRKLDTKPGALSLTGGFPVLEVI